MQRLKWCWLLLVVAVVEFSSCKDSNEYRVDSTFTPYLNRFDSIAKLKNKVFDLESTGLIIEFANLKDNNAGLTHYETPIRIEIDKTYWNDISGYAGADLMKEDLIFHELGHGLLKRDHLNATLENGDWKSIMCGGTKVNDRAWNINYRGVRRSYYIDELFNESTPAPAFSSLQLLADTTGYTPRLKLNFNTTLKSDFGWDVKNDSQITITSVNGRLSCESKVSEVLFMFVYVNYIDVQSNFSFELNIEYPSTTDLAGQYGLIYGKIPGTVVTNKDSVEYFSINNNQKMYMGNHSWYSFFTELNEKSIVPNGKNKLKIFKIGNMQYYFINNVYVYSSEIEVKGSGFGFGFMVPPKGTVLLDNLAIAQRFSSGIGAKVKQNQIVEFKIVTSKSLNQNIIRK